MTETAQKIRNGIFLAASRTYGEQYMEAAIRERFNLIKPSESDRDADNPSDGDQVEIKCNKVLLAVNNKKNKTLMERILFENTVSELNRLIPFSACLTADYLANVQNVKRDHFDKLIYVLLFEDCIKIFSVKRNDVKNIPGWSEKHGRYDALGKSGQFTIKKKQIQWHLDNTLIDTISYEEMVDIYEKLSK